MINHFDFTKGLAPPSFHLVLLSTRPRPVEVSHVVTW